MKLSKSVLCGPAGWYAEVYTDDDGASGYGDNARIGYWYGTREECERLDPNCVPLYPIAPETRADEFDYACERRSD